MSNKKILHKNWVKNNRDKVNEIEKRYYKKNRNIILSKAKSNRIKNKDKINKNHEKILAENPWRKHYYSLRSRCNNIKNKQYHNYGGRGIKANISREEIKELWFRDKAYDMEKPSIDRIDNNWHYTFENCRFIEHAENIRKSNKDRFFKSSLDYSI